MKKAQQFLGLSFLLLSPLFVLGQHGEIRFNIENETSVVYPESIYQQEGLSYIPDTAHYPNNYEKYMDIVRRSVQHSRFETAIYWCNRALRTPIITQLQKAKIYKLLLGLHVKTGNYHTAIDMHFKTLAHTQDPILIAESKANISNVYTFISDYDRAAQLLSEAKKQFEKNGDTIMVAHVLLVESNLFKAKKRPAQSILINQESGALLFRWLEENNTKNPKYNKVRDFYHVALNNIADMYLIERAPDSALTYLEKIMFQPSTPKDIQAAVFISYGEAWMQKGQSEKSLNYFKQGLKIAEELNLHNILSTAYKALSELSASQQNFQEAWNYQQKFIHLNEATISSENIHKMNQLQIQYAVAKKDKELAESALRNNRNQLTLNKRNNQLYLLLISIGFSGVVIAFIFRNAFNRQRFLKAQVKNAAQQKHIVQIEATLKGEENERERIAQELHDSVVSEILALRINLKNVSHKHAELQFSEDYRNVLYQSQELTEKLRRATHNMMPARLKELGLVKTIAAFVKRLNSHKLRIDFQCYGRVVQLKDSSEKMLLMITHELVQNILKHAKATRAIVQLNYFEESLSLTVEDNGVGLNNVSQAKEGIGWQNIQKNIQMLNAQIDIQSSEFKGTTILIELSLQEHLPDTTAAVSAPETFLS